MDRKVLVEYLRSKFKIRQYKKGTILEELAVSSGEQNVIDYIERMPNETRIK